jgi:hypothetical protein
MALSKIDVANMLTGTIPVDNSKSGSILQVQSTLYNTPFTQAISANTSTAINNLSVNITPSSTSSKIMLFARFMGEYGTATNYDLVFFILRGSTKINVGVSEGDRTTGTIANFMGFYNADADNTPDGTQLVTLDASHNSTSQLTYHIGLQTRNADTMYVNRTVGDSNSTATERFSSEIIAMEIKG